MEKQEEVKQQEMTKKRLLQHSSRLVSIEIGELLSELNMSGKNNESDDQKWLRVNDSVNNWDRKNLIESQKEIKMKRRQHICITTDLI